MSFFLILYLPALLISRVFINGYYPLRAASLILLLVGVLGFLVVYSPPLSVAICFVFSIQLCYNYL